MATVKDLIEKLSALDPNLRVYFDDASYGMSEINHATIETGRQDLLDIRHGDAIVRLSE